MQASSPAFLVHEPLLMNLLGHAAGTLIFGIFLVLLWRDRAGQKLHGGWLALVSAALAFVWNAGSILALALAGTALAQVLLALLAMALSLLPACLLDLLLAGRLRWLARAGYSLSVAAMALHALEPVLDLRTLGARVFHAADLHSLTLVVTSIGFALLTLLAALLLLRNAPPGRPPLVTRTVAAMGLFLFALSFAHFQPTGGHSGWLAELVIHHAGIPVALFLLLQDYRFLLLDAFLRFLANILLAAVFTWALWRAGWLHLDGLQPPAAAFALLGVCGGLILYAFAREFLQLGLTRLLFQRRPLEPVLAELRQLRFEDEEHWTARVAGITGAYFGAHARLGLDLPDPTAEGGVCVRIHPDLQLALGRRAGGRRYLSEDRQALEAMAAQLRTGLAQYREMELRRLVSEAELKALQAQIHPHFLFNALNTLYGLIPRDARGARDTVLNLADMLRFFLHAGERLIPLDEELRIVRAYLGIEGLRLGAKLQSRVEAGPAALRALVPALSVQPLVENAVQHAIAPNPQGGTLRVTAALVGAGAEAAVEIVVIDSGGAFEPSPSATRGLGVGLENVRRRLRLHFGESAVPVVETESGRTVVRFRVPAAAEAAPGPAQPSEAAAR
ncbi:MAG: sensor histidine kinase [Bryobacteraceae bacterium]